MIGYYVHHQGLGHLTRLQAIAEHLKAPVTGISSLPAPEGWASDWLHLARDDGMPAAEAAGADPTAGGAMDVRRRGGTRPSKREMPPTAHSVARRAVDQSSA